MRIAGAVQLLLDALALFLPEVLYALTEAWKHGEDTEPSKLYLLFIRCTGAVLCAVGVFTLFGFL